MNVKNAYADIEEALPHVPMPNRRAAAQDAAHWLATELVRAVNLLASSEDVHFRPEVREFLARHGYREGGGA